MIFSIRRLHFEHVNHELIPGSRRGSLSKHYKVQHIITIMPLRCAVDFHGLGGMALALLREVPNAEIVFCSDNAHPCRRVMDVLSPRAIKFTDVDTRTDAQLQKIGELDGYVASPPCKDFAPGSKNKGSTTKRGRLSRHVLKVLRFNKPKAAVYENTVGLNRARHRQVVKKIKQVAEEVGYRVEEMVLDSANFNVPQTRKRLHIVFLRRDAEVVEWAHVTPANFVAPHVSADTILAAPRPGTQPCKVPTHHRQRKLVLAGLKRARDVEGVNPAQVPVLIDVDCSFSHKSSKVNHFNTLTASRGGSGGPYISTRSERTSMAELCSVQGYPPQLMLKIKQRAQLSNRQFGYALGDAVTFPVARAVIKAAFQAVGLLPNPG